MVSDEAQAVEVHRLNSAARLYRLDATLREGESLTTPLRPELALGVSALFE
jgi:hypothetical protein